MIYRRQLVAIFCYNMTRLVLTTLFAIFLFEGRANPIPVDQFIDINPTGDGLYNLASTEFIVFNDIIYFGADDGQHGLELWRSDGTDTGTYLVADINPESGASNPYGFIEFNHKLFFSAKDDTHGIELWRTDGTHAGTKLLSDINSSGDALPDQKAIMGNKLYFQADNGSNGFELWITDGTAGGTLMLIDLNNTGSSFPRNMAAVEPTWYFGLSKMGRGNYFAAMVPKEAQRALKA
jgi:ELWxxDGT repeat protein